MTHVERRKRFINYSIKRGMQLRLLFKVMTVAFLGIVLASVIFYVHSNIKIEGSFKQFHILGNNFLEYLLPVVLIALLIGVVFAAALAILFPHRIAGPLYRIEKNLKDRVRDGDLTVKFSIREGDEMGELVDSLNTMMTGLNVRLKKIKESAEILDSLLRGPDETISLDKIRELSGIINNGVAGFKLKA
ncbi:MAG: HAMP domain-containing protein [Thermodesulfobacteriota bacterium]